MKKIVNYLVLLVLLTGCAAPTIKEEIADLRASFEIKEVAQDTFVARGDRLTYGTDRETAKQVGSAFARLVAATLKSAGHRFFKFVAFLQKTQYGQYATSGRELVAVVMVSPSGGRQNGFETVEAPISALELYSAERRKLPLLEGFKLDQELADKWNL